MTETVIGEKVSEGEFEDKTHKYMKKHHPNLKYILINPSRYPYPPSYYLNKYILKVSLAFENRAHNFEAGFLKSLKPQDIDQELKTFSMRMLSAMTEDLTNFIQPGSCK